MKKIILFIIILSTGILTACTNSDTSDGISEGKWTLETNLVSSTCPNADEEEPEYDLSLDVTIDGSTVRAATGRIRLSGTETGNNGIDISGIDRLSDNTCTGQVEIELNVDEIKSGYSDQADVTLTYNCNPGTAFGQCKSNYHGVFFTNDQNN